MHDSLASGDRGVITGRRCSPSQQSTYVEELEVQKKAQRYFARERGTPNATINSGLLPAA